MGLRALTIDLKANIANFTADMNKAARVAKRESERIKRQFDVAMKAVTASSIAAGAGLATLVKKTANTADQIQKMSNRLGVSTEFLSQYRHVAELSGTSIDRVGDSIRKMSKSVNDADNGLSTAKRAFDSIGISVDQLKRLSPEQQFELIADRISKVESQSVKAGAAMDIFGRSGSELLTVLNAGSDGIKEMREEADRLGLTISQSAADSAAHFNDELTRLGNKMQGIAESIGVSLIPAVTQIIENFNSEEVTQGINKWGTLNDIVVGLYAGVLYLDGAFETVGRAVGKLAAQTVQALSVMGDLIEAFGKRVKLGALTIVETFANDIKSKAEKLNATDLLPDFIKNSTASESAQELTQQISDLETEALQLAQVFRDGVANDTTLQDAIDRYSGIERKINEVREARLKEIENINSGYIPALGAATNATGKLDPALKDIRATIKNLRKEHRPIQTMFQDLAKNLAALNKARLSPDFSVNEYQEGFELIQEEAESMASNIVGQVEDIFKKIPFLMGEAVEEAEKADLSGMFDGFASGLNPAISALQQFRNEISTINELTSNGDFTVGQQAFYSTGLAAEFALNSMASMAQEGSAAQKKLQAAAAITNTILGITAILEQGKGDPYTAFARMAAMAAMVASLGVQVAGAFGGAGGGGAEQQQERQGTGTVLGDSGAKSESITNSLDMIASATQKIVGINSRMLRSLDLMNDAISGTVTEIGKLGTIGDLGTTASTSLGGLDSFLFGGSKVTDRGIELLGGSISEAINGDLFQAYEIAKKKGLFGSSRRINTAELGQGISSQIGLIFESMNEAILAGAESLGVDMDAVQNALDSYQIEAQRISLMDLSPDEQRAELEAVFSSIFDGLVSVSLPFLAQFQQAGEGLGETLARVSTTVLVFEEAIGSMGLDFIAKELDPELFALAAVSISEFAGGMEEFIDGYTNYVSNFLSEAEQLQIVTDRISGVFSDLGLTLPDAREGFTQLIQGLDLTTTAGQEAFGSLIALSGEMDSYYSGLEENQQRVAQQAQQLVDHISGIASSMENMDLSTFAKSLKDIALQYNENIRVAKKLGASEQELAMIQAYATRQIQAAIRQLEQNISGALTDLYGSELDRINEQIALLEEQESQINSVSQANENRYAAELQAIKDIHGFVDSLLLDNDLSPLNPFERLSEAQRQFDELFASAQSGDVEALQNLPEMARELLGLRRDVFASQDYENFAGGILGQLSSLGVTSSPVEQNPQQTIIGQNQQLIALQEERNRLEAAFDSEAHRNAVLAVAEQIKEWASVSGESFTELADRLEIPVEQFLSDLGVSLDELTVETALALAETATLLGVEITDLADSVGLSLGDLADDQSLLNDALERTILTLPSGIADDLDAMLTAIERSTNPQAREALLADLESRVDELPVDQRDLLAPFFENIDPQSDAQRQIELMESQTNHQQEIRNAIQAQTESQQTETRNVADNVAALTTEQSQTNALLVRVIDNLRATGAAGGFR